MRIFQKNTLVIFVTILLITCSWTVEGQNYEKLYKRGIEAFYGEDFDAAIEHFGQIESSGKSVKDSEYRLEISYLVLPQYRERSLEKILKFSETKSRSDKFYNYWMGRIYANRYMFPEAVKAWESFLDKKGYKSEEIVAETRNYMERAQKLVTYFDNPDNFEIHQLEGPINTEFAEITPVYSEEKNELLFASNRSNASEDQFKIYHSEHDLGDWSTPTPLDVLGTFEREKANVEVVNEDGKLFIFKDVKKGDLYYSQPGANGWNVPVEFDSKITSTHLGSHFFINEHEDRIIFASKSKKSGLDLMESYRNAESGKWEKPHPFAANLNTEYNEDSPFLSQDETKLYFLSDRPNGVGGYDVYVSEIDDQTQQWSEPENMGWPINSPDDEIHFKMNPDGKSGYFSSNRIHSKGDFDIYFFWRIEKTSIEGRVINALTQEPVVNGEIRFHPSQYMDEYFRSILDESGKYKTTIISDEVFKVEVISKSDTLLTENFEVHEVKGDKVTHFKDFYVIPKDISDSMRLVLEAKYRQPELSQKRSNPDELIASATDSNQIKKDPTPPQVQEVDKPLNNTGNKSIIIPKSSSSSLLFVGSIYFEFGTSTITDSSEPRLNEILKYLQDNPTKKIEIGGHTDNIGSSQVNQVVSENRAQAAKKWLVDHGIKEDRMVAKGYGEEQPMASNDDEKDGRSLNRRIEIRIMK
ncbi:MAG: OmpA family protein [Marinoscillum sp.]